MNVLLGLAAVPVSKARPYLKSWDRHGLGVELIQSFTRKQKGGNRNGYRLYLPIKASDAPTPVPPTPIVQAVHSAGYVIEDYVTGIASKDGGARKIKIGKLLSKDAHLKMMFDQDKNRQSRAEEYFCVISAHPYDIIGMSTGRRWDQTSCMRIGLPKDRTDDGAFVETLKHDITEGTLVAYAITASDKNIEKPHARYLIRPFKSVSDDSVVFKIAIRPYGNEIPGFKQAIDRWLKKVNAKAKQGLYKMPAELYDDGQDRNHLMSVDPSKFRRREDMENFLQKAVENAGDQVNKTLLLASKKWLQPLLQHYTDTDAVFSKYYDCLDIAKQAGVTGKEIGKAIDLTIGADNIQGVISSVMFSSNAPFYVKNSERFRDWIAENVTYDESKEAPDRKLLSIAILNDARWASKIAPTPLFVKNVFNMLMQGRGMPIPKDLRKVKGGLADTLNQLLSMVVSLSNSIGQASIADARETILKLNSLKYKDDLSYSDEKRDILFDCFGYVWLCDHHPKASVIGTLGALDARWIEHIPLSFSDFDDISIFRVWDKVMASDSEPLKKIIAQWIMSKMAWRAYVTSPRLVEKIGMPRVQAVLDWMQTSAEMKFDVPKFMADFAVMKKFYS